MAYLQESEWILLNELAYNVAFIYDYLEMQSYFLRNVQLLISHDASLFASLRDDKSGFKLVDLAAQGLSGEQTDTWGKSIVEDEYTKWVVQSARSQSFLESRLFLAERRQKSDFYRDFYEPCGLFYGLGLCIVFREQPLGFLHFLRKSSSGDFQTRDLFVLDQLQKHLSYRLAYEKNKGDARYFYAKGYFEKLCNAYKLTMRERELFQFAIQGCTNAEIGEQMNISVHTVKKHFSSLYEKMGVHNRVQLLQCFPLSTDKINFDDL